MESGTKNKHPHIRKPQCIFYEQIVIVHLGSMYLHVGRDALLFFLPFFYDAFVRKNKAF